MADDGYPGGVGADDDPEDDDDMVDEEDEDFIDDDDAGGGDEDASGGDSSDEDYREGASSSSRSKRSRAKPKKGAASKKRPRRSAAAMFFEDEAGVGEDEEEEEDSEFAGEAAEAARMAREADRRRRATLAQHRPSAIDDIDTPELIASRYEAQASIPRGNLLGSRKCLRESGVDYQLEDEGDDVDGVGASEADRKALLPTMRDPKLYIVRCKPGKERDVLNQILSGAHALSESQPGGAVQPVLSAVWPQHLRGYVYVESARESDARAAVTNLRWVFKSAKLQIVPLGEMESVVAGAAEQEVVRPNDWVRVKRGIYKGDIAQVIQFDPANSVVEIRLVPRIDYADLQQQQQLKEGGGNNAAAAAAAARNSQQKRPKHAPEPKFFVPEELGISKGDIQQKTDAKLGDVVVWNNRRFANGYIIKSVSTTALEMQGVRPTLEQLQRFDREGLQGMDRDAINKLLNGAVGARRADSFRRGDVVRVCDGDLVNLVATVEKTEGDQVYVRAHDARIKAVLPLPPAQLVKYFKGGDHVRVCGGLLEGMTGTVLRVDAGGAAHKVTILGDVDIKEHTVLAGDLCLSAGSDGISIREAAAASAAGGYRAGDLVLLPAQRSAGIVVRVDAAGTYAVLDAEGRVQTLPAPQLGRRVGSSGSASHGARHNARAEQGYDSRAKAITAGDLVQVTEGPMAGRQAVIRHLYKAKAFLYAREVWHALAGCLHRGEGVPAPDTAEALRLYRLAAAKGLAAAQTSLGRLYLTGELGVERAPEQAVQLFRLAAEQGHTPAQVSLGTCYEHGDGVVQEIREAIKLYRQAAEQGDAQAQYRMASCYQEGIGVAQNMRKAAQLYQLSADQGLPEAQFALAQYYLKGEWVAKDPKEAMRLYRESAEKGFVKAQAALAGRLLTGDHIDKDEHEAARLFQLAADQGHASSQYNLALMHQNGIGVPKDKHKAAKLFKSAADQKHAKALFALGQCYEKGDGVNKDKMEATRLYRLASELGDELSKAKLK
eukprot:m51a1_g1506 putative transcription elongation factor spt5 isoform x1 (1002) ;mRNA; f:378964-384785